MLNSMQLKVVAHISSEAKSTSVPMLGSFEISFVF